MMSSFLVIEDAELNPESGKLTVLVKNRGPSTGELQLNATTFFVRSLSSGRNYTVMVDVSSITLRLNEVARITSPPLPDLSRGDIVFVKVTAEASSFAAAAYCRTGESVKLLSECS